MLRFLLIFLGLLSFGVLLLTQPEVKHILSEPWGQFLADTVYRIVSVWDTSAVRHGNVLSNSSASFAVSIDAECNGIDAVLILWCAILAFPAGWKQKAAGLPVAFLGVQLLNMVRIVSLFYLGQWDRTIFIWSHHNLWQGIMILWCLLLFFLWLSLIRGSRRGMHGNSFGSV